MRVLPAVVWGKLRGKPLMQILTPTGLRTAYVPVSKEQGQLLYLLARSRSARNIVEFGASFGISTVYLGAAAKDNGGTLVTEPAKCRATEESLRAAGLADCVRVLEGDALQTLKTFEGPVDFVFLDGWKDLYLPVLTLLRPNLAPRAVIFADNTNFRDTRPYVQFVRDPKNGFASGPLLDGRSELSVLTG